MYCIIHAYFTRPASNHSHASLWCHIVYGAALSLINLRYLSCQIVFDAILAGVTLFLTLHCPWRHVVPLTPRCLRYQVVVSYIGISIAVLKNRVVKLILVAVFCNKIRLQ